MDHHSCVFNVCDITLVFYKIHETKNYYNIKAVHAQCEEF